MSDIYDQLANFPTPWLEFEERCDYIAAITADRLQSFIEMVPDEDLEDAKDKDVDAMIYEFAEWLDESCILDEIIWEQFVEYVAHKE